MARNSKTIKLIFGFKVRYLRQGKKLSYQQLSTLTGLSISYIHDIERGKKYPKADKIVALANALEVEYDYLVSLRATKKLQPVIDLLNSDFLKQYPLEMFGISTEKLLEMFANAPHRLHAFISTVFKITRNYQMTREHFYKAALRSFQDMHDNYFEELETAVHDFRKQFKLRKVTEYTSELLEDLLLKGFGIRVDREQLQKEANLSGVRSYFSAPQKVLYLNKNLSAPQEKFLLGRELAFQQLQLEERPMETRILRADSFDKLLNNFKASYFSVALLMDEHRLTKDFQQVIKLKKWNPQKLLDLLEKYDVSPEMLMQRLTNILPKHFGLNDLFFLRIEGSADLKTFRMTKELHLSQHHTPHANELNEHYCQRWVSIGTIKRIRAASGTVGYLADTQISKYWGTENHYLCFSIAKPRQEKPKRGVSVTLGLSVNDQLRKYVGFLNDPNLRQKDVNKTCERCDMPNCGARVAPPIRIEAEQELTMIEEALKGLS